MPREIRYGDEKGLTARFSSFLSLMDCSMAPWIHMTCWEKSTAFFCDALGQLGNTPSCICFLFFPTLFLLSLDLIALNYTSQ